MKKKTQRTRTKYVPPKTRIEKREEEIKRVLAIALFEKQKPLSMRAIARKMDVWEGGWLMDILNDMADRGELSQRVIPHNRGRNQVRYLFSLPPGKVAAAARSVWS